MDPAPERREIAIAARRQKPSAIRVIKDAPVAFFCLVLLIAIPIAYLGASWRYGVTIENKESLISYLQRQLDDLQKNEWHR